MAGLLDNLMGDSIDDPRTMGLLSLAASLSSGKRFMPALAQGLAARQGLLADAEKQKQAKALYNLQMQQHQLSLNHAQMQNDAMKRNQAFLESIPDPRQQAINSVIANGGGAPTVANAAKIPDMTDQSLMLQAVKAGAMPVASYIASMQKDTSPLTLKEGETLVDRKTFKPIFSAPGKDDKPAALREYEYAVGQGYKGSLLDYQLAQKRAGASTVSVNTGQRGFENTLKLRGDFRSEPVYKAHQEMQSAHSQIQQALKAGTPVGDLAGATKIMKLLDPGSVVRESELGMAMQATGLMDRVQNYAGMIINGNKLTPQQRKEFQTLADSLMAQSSELYNAKRGEYGSIAQRNGLNVEDVTGAAGVVPRMPSAPGANSESDPLGLYSR